MKRTATPKLATCPNCDEDVVAGWEDCLNCGVDLPPFENLAKAKPRIPKGWVAVGLAIVFGLILAAGGTSSTADGTDDLKYGAFDVCTQYVGERLKAPSTAEFRNPYRAGGDGVRFSNVGDLHTVRSVVDAQNGFGAQIRTSWDCKVRHVDGDRWRLVNLTTD